MLSMLVFYDVTGVVVGTLDVIVQYDEDRNPIGLVDFEAHELTGGKMRDIADMQRLDQPVPKGIAKQFLGHDPQEGEVVTLPPDHPYRLAHETVAGAATWPEWLGTEAHDFKVELDDNKRITALVHRSSRVKRKRSDIEAAIAERINEKAQEAKKRGDEMRAVAKAKGLPRNVVEAMPDPEPEPADLRSILGGPDRPLLLDPDGRTRPRPAKSQRPSLPIVAVGKG